MNLDEFVSEFANVFEDTDLAGFSAETNFKDVSEWSSLTAMSVIAMIRLKYGVAISGLDVNKCTTVAEVYALVEKAYG